jgi:molecular chaperone HtpG
MITGADYSRKRRGYRILQGTAVRTGEIPFDFYSRDFAPGVQLYSSGVLIMDKCADLVPEHFRFIRGIVDTQDVSLNISRELLQHNRQLKIIAANIDKKVRSELLRLQEENRADYEKFYGNFGMQLKYGTMNDYGRNKDTLKDLLMFCSSAERKLVTFKEYISRMPEDQKSIFYVAGEDASRIDKLPQTEAFKAKGYELLYLTDSIDEMVLQMIGE